ncbi:MAG: site-2 protease family protein [Chloroflexota bacterium]
MKNGFRIARVFGISIELDWSWLFIFLLITWNLSAVFASMHPEWGTGLIWGMAVLASVLFFLSVLLHELAHSLVAKARGLPVRRIVLFLFGGVSNIEREPPSPGTEFLMALVGPVTSIALGIALMLAGSLTTSFSVLSADPMSALGLLSPLTTLLMWLGSINVFLGIFNLLPAFPLDGGRILRSIFWAVSNNLRRATQWASWIGQAIAWGLIIAGIAMAFGMRIPIFGTGVIGGLWLAFIGWFLNSSAVSSYRQVVIQDILEDVPAGRIMRPNPPVVSSTLTVEQVVYDGVMGTDDHAFPVVDDGRLVGLVTLEDIRAVPRDAWRVTLVREIMTPLDELVSVVPEEDAAEALNKLQARDVRQLPVVRKDGALVGLLRQRDIVRWLQLQSDVQVT